MADPRESKTQHSRDSRYSAGMTPEQLGEELVKRATDGDLAAVNKLVLAGAPVNYTTKYGYTALIKACRMQRVEVAEVLIALGADVNAKSKNGWTSLIEACRVGHVGLADKLIEKGAKVDDTNVMGWTAMIEACRNRHLPIVQLLVSRGSRVDHRDKDNMTALDHTSRALKNIIDFLEHSWKEKLPKSWEAAQAVKPMSKGDELAAAASNGDFGKLEELILRKGYPIDSPTSNGAYTPLFMACRAQRLDVVEWLIEKGADVNKPSETHWYPVIEASRVGNLDILNTLLGFGKFKNIKADINATNDFGWHGLIEACRNSNYDIVERSIELGVNVNYVDKDGEIAMDHASEPWIRGLLQGGPRAKVKAVVVASRGRPVAERCEMVLKRIAEVLGPIDMARPGESELSPQDARLSIFEALCQEVNPDILLKVLNLPGFTDAIRASNSNIVRALVQLDLNVAAPPASAEEKAKAKGRVAWPNISPVIDVIINSLFAPHSHEITEFVGMVDKTSGRNAALEAAHKYAAFLEKAFKDGSDAKKAELAFSQAQYYFDVLLFLLQRGVSVAAQDNGRFTVVSLLLRPIKACNSYGPALDFVYDHFWQFYRVPEHRRHITPALLNLRAAEDRTPICYVLVSSPHPSREETVFQLLEDGAKLPDQPDDPVKYELEQAKLMAMVSDAMRDSPGRAWTIMRNAVIHADSTLVHKIILRKLPIYMVNPTSERVPFAYPNTVENEDEGEHTTTSDGSEEVGGKNAIDPVRGRDLDFDECLIHLAVDQEQSEKDNIPIFNELLAYSEQRSQRVNATFPCFPWPIDQAAGNQAVSYSNSYGMNVFHVIASRKNASPSSTNFYYFQTLLKLDIHAVVTRWDNAGWSALHYAAYWNKYDIVHLLIDSHIDLNQTNNRRRSPLHLAAFKGNWAIVESLCNEKVNINGVDESGLTPLALAMLQRQHLLRKHKKHASSHAKSAAQETAEQLKKDVETAFRSGVAAIPKHALPPVPRPLSTGLVRAGSDLEAPKKLSSEASAGRQGGTYNFTIQSLLKHGASILEASTASGLELGRLMNVDERWVSICRTLSGIENYETEAENKYFSVVNTPSADFVARRNAKNEMELKQNVLSTLRGNVFVDQENQIVIKQKYDDKVRTSRVTKFIRYAIFLTLFTILGVLESTRSNHTAYHMQRSLSNSMGSAWSNIGSAADFYKFVNDVLINGPMYGSPPIYEGSQHTVGTIDQYNTVLGAPRLRQVRSRQVDCDYADVFSKFPSARTCFGDIEEFEDKSSYTVNGRTYTWGDDIGANLRWGRVNTYPPSGFPVVLPDPRRPTAQQNATDILNNLQADNWIDAATRAVFLEFTLYNANANHFMTCQFLAEFLLSGSVVSSTDFNVMRLKRYMDEDDHDILFPLEVVVIIFVFFHIWGEQRQMIASHNCSYFSSFYNWMDFAIVIMSPCIIALHVANMYYGSDVQWYAEDVYIHLNRQEALAFAETILFSLVVFFAWIKLFDYLSVFQTMQRFMIMLEMMIQSLKWILIVLLLIFATFTSAEFVAYGHQDDNSSTWLIGYIARWEGVFSSAPIQFSNAGEGGHANRNRILGTFYVIVFTVTVSLLVLNLIIAILTSAFDDAQELSSDVLAERQYARLKEMGLTKAKRLAALEELDRMKQESSLVGHVTAAPAQIKKLITESNEGVLAERLDAGAYSIVMGFFARLDDVFDRVVVAQWAKGYTKEKTAHDKSLHEQRTILNRMHAEDFQKK